MTIRWFATLCLIAYVMGLTANAAFAGDSATQVIRKNTADFAPQLQNFDRFLGGWSAELTFQPGKPPVSDVTLFEKVLNGKALKTTHSIDNGMYGGESFVFWNNKTERLEFHYFTTADFFTMGWMEFVSDDEFVAYEDVTGESAVSQGISKVKSASKLVDDSMIVSTSYLKNGEWTEPETRKYTRTTKDVVFN